MVIAWRAVVGGGRQLLDSVWEVAGSGPGLADVWLLGVLLETRPREQGISSSHDRRSESAKPHNAYAPHTSQ